VNQLETVLKLKDEDYSRKLEASVLLSKAEQEKFKELETKNALLELETTRCKKELERLQQENKSFVKSTVVKDDINRALKTTLDEETKQKDRLLKEKEEMEKKMEHLVNGIHSTEDLWKESETNFKNAIEKQRPFTCYC